MVRLLAAVVLLGFAANHYAQAVSVQPVMRLLQDRYPGAEIQITESALRWRGEVIENISQAQVQSEILPGVLLVRVVGSDASGMQMSSLVEVPHQAWLQVPHATRRIAPKERITQDLVRWDRVDVAQSPYSAQRGILIHDEKWLKKAESRYTILEGSPLLANAIQDAPDVLRGDGVKILIQSGELSLSIQGTSLDSVRVGERIRTMTIKGKREFTGTLVAPDTVEVRL
jgi:flagella basal body P-ring formation protein FlgA